MNNLPLENVYFLYIEDDASSRTVMELIVNKVLGTQNITILENSVDFMARIKALPRRPDIALLDIHLRPHDGFEILRALRADPEYRGTKIVALTASVMNEEVEKMRLSGFDGAIGKPLSREAFPDLITRILNGESVWSIS